MAKSQKACMEQEEIIDTFGTYQVAGNAMILARHVAMIRARPRVGPRHQPSWLPDGGPLPSLGDSGRFRHADFLYIFPGIFGALLMAGKPEIQKLQKTETGNWVH